MMRPQLGAVLGVLALLAMAGGSAVLPVAAGAEEWETILQHALGSEYSQTRQDGLKQIDTKSSKGLKALWKILSFKDWTKVDWYVREGAYEALLDADGEDAEKEIDRVLKGGEDELAREAVLYSMIWKMRRQVVRDNGENDDNKIAEVKYDLRKKRGVDYFNLVLPSIKRLDPQKKYLARFQAALEDKSPRVRRAAITGLTAYPDASSVPLLLGFLKKIEKQKAKSYREWVLARNALETLTGQYFRESLADWERWWEVLKDKFTIEKRIAEQKIEEGDDERGRTVVVRKEGVEVTVHMKVAGDPDGYPLLVLPWMGMEVDYFRPYFHGVEEFCRAYYVRMPLIEDYKGLVRDNKTNLVRYPTQLLSQALVDVMKESGLDRFGVLAHGPDAGQLAAMLQAEHPDKVTHLVFINPRSRGSAYRDAIENVRREGLKVSSSEVVKGADSLLIEKDGKPKYQPADSAEQSGVSRAISNLRHADPTEPEAGSISYFYNLPSGVQVLADDSWELKKIVPADTSRLSVLVLMGTLSPWTPVNDMRAAASVYKGAKVIELKGSAEFPFISETYAFTRYLEVFFKPANQARQKEKAKASGRKGSAGKK